MGRDLIEMLLGLQGDGDLGESLQTADERTLHRSDEKKTRRLRTIFAEHRFEQSVYSAGKGKTIELRPPDARRQLPLGVCSYLLEEFSQLFCVEGAFDPAASNIKGVFGQSLPVDTLESVNRPQVPESSTGGWPRRPRSSSRRVPFRLPPTKAN